LLNGYDSLVGRGSRYIPTAWSVVGTGDFNGDGNSDILWRDTSGNTAIWFMNGASVASTGGLGNISTAWSVAQTGDYNGDGKSDILWRDTSGNTAIWFMNGRPSRRPVGSAIYPQSGQSNLPTPSDEGQSRPRIISKGRRSHPRPAVPE